jgi:FkbM family methyltransferase
MNTKAENRRFRPKVQALVRYGSAIARIIPLDLQLFREFLIVGSTALSEYQLNFNFRSRRLNVLWSAGAFPDRLTRHMLFHGLYQNDVLLWIKHYGKPGNIVFDVGAFHGLMSIVASKAVGPGGRVIAFEPNPVAREWLNTHLRLNKCANVTVESVGLMDFEGAADFYVQEGDVTWNSSFVRDFVDSRHKLAPVTVECTSIDAYVRNTGLIPDLIKIDTEGTELSVLQGAKETIEKHRPVLVLEMNPSSARKAGTTLSKLVNELESLSYVLKVMKPTKWGRFSLKNEELFKEIIHTANDLTNVVCVPSESGRSQKTKSEH